MSPIQHSTLPHYNQRPANTRIDTIIIHSMCALSAVGSELDAQTCIAELDCHQVAAHYLIARDGVLWQLVDEKHRAWHAGESIMPPEADDRKGVNDFSIGIELLAQASDIFTDEQYLALASLSAGIISRHPIKYILGHQHVATPHGRKSDPGENFNWTLYLDKLANYCDCSSIIYPEAGKFIPTGILE